METRTASIEEWRSYNTGQRQEDMAPLHFSVTGNSMYPLFRSSVDDITVMPVTKKLKKGDIVLVHAKTYCGDYFLHRILKVRDGKYLTMGDGNLQVDGWFGEDRIHGIAVCVRRGKREIDLEGGLMWLAGRFWMATRPVRRILLRVIRKTRRHRVSDV